MSAKLAAGIEHSKPPLLEEEAALNIARTYQFLQQRWAEFFKEFGLTATQYNILRILRGAGKDGLTCSQAAGRMVVADPDVTRLLDRLEARQLIQRERATGDRRVVVSRLTDQGLELLKSIDRPLAELNKQLMGGPGRQALKQLVKILESIRRE